MTRPQLVATAWTSAGDMSPMRVTATSPVPITERVAVKSPKGRLHRLGLHRRRPARRPRHHPVSPHCDIDLRPRTHRCRNRTDRAVVGTSRRSGKPYHVRELLFDAADDLVPRSSRSAPNWYAPTAYRERLIEPLRELVTQATEHGTRVAIETMPFSIISTVPDGSRNRLCSRSSWNPDCCWMPGTYSAQARR